jgi:acetyl-CoA carboxylase alpha subunit
MAESIKNALIDAVTEFKALPTDELLRRRRARLAAVGRFKEA